MSSEEEDEVKLYSALEHNKKRQMMVSLSSSSDEDGNDNDFDEFLILETPTKRRRQSVLLDKAVKKKKSQILPDKSDEDDDFYTPSEREAERLRKLQLEREIRLKLKQDNVLNQTRAILSKVLSTKRQTTANNLECISLDSDTADESDDGAIIEPTPSQPVVVDKGAKIVLHIRSNGGAKETFDQLYTSYCELHGLPRTAIKMSLDGEALSLEATPDGEDLDSGDLIEAKVDFSKQIESKKKTYLRLRLVVFGKRSEIFKIDSTATVEKLHTSYCKRHAIANPDDVVMSVQDQELRLNERIDFYGLMDHDEISVKCGNSVAPAQTIELQLRFGEDDRETHQVIPSSKVEGLLVKIAKEKKSEASKISLMLDGKKMAASQTFMSYGLGDGELIEVKIAS
ncbi:unnamed protein product [Peronospora farinosa]|uniref:Ubiquitin-like domain-containing protein n=1 Tax=Peronospora farinosa TaxID=134698 RepID=A0AAV0UTL3_9STRA|nr:unnamed protein product [Peronospora farinosa]